MTKKLALIMLYNRNVQWMRKKMIFLASQGHPNITQKAHPGHKQ